jgi:hypothetical protein
MGAADAKLSEAVTLLRTEWAIETRGVLNGEYAFWLGSGISRDRYPDVSTLIHRLLTTLQAGIVVSDPQCPFRRALNAILALATISSSPDLTRVPADWSNIKEIVNRLVSRYSEALDVELRGSGSVKELFWDVLKLQHVYGDPVRPDAEHRLLSLLIEEGIISVLVTTNWDPLIELAIEDCRPGSVLLVTVVACNAEIPGSNNGSARILKIHGCARKALAQPDKYREFLVATKTQINRWSHEQSKKPFVELNAAS